MTYAINKKQSTLAVSCALALGVFSNSTIAQMSPADTGYLGDQRGSIVKSDFGLCWHNGTGPAAASTAECDPNYRAPEIAKAVEPMPVKVAALTPAPTPAPTPVLAPVPAPQRVIEKVTFDADTLFDFDKADLRPAGLVILDGFVGRINDIKPEAITAVGHADRFGTAVYNQHLSEQRVEAVKTYLVSKGIEPGRVHTDGKGETQPVTKSGECDGAKSAKVIACLQPDRRVEVEVVGTRVVQ